MRNHKSIEILIYWDRIWNLDLHRARVVVWCWERLGRVLHLETYITPVRLRKLLIFICPSFFVPPEKRGIPSQLFWRHIQIFDFVNTVLTSLLIKFWQFWSGVRFCEVGSCHVLKQLLYIVQTQILYQHWCSCMSFFATHLRTEI